VMKVVITKYMEQRSKLKMEMITNSMQHIINSFSCLKTRRASFSIILATEPNLVLLKLIIVLFYDHWEIRVNYPRIHPKMRHVLVIN
jgi:5-methylcytosine-specific restriction endonuclease McrBC regulatory subunit McrC